MPGGNWTPAPANREVTRRRTKAPDTTESVGETSRPSRLFGCCRRTAASEPAATASV